MRKKYCSLTVFVFLLAFSLSGQELRDDDQNKILFPGESARLFGKLFASLNKLIITGEGTINIIHLGDSHVQAGFFPGEVRKRMVSEMAMGCGARGLIFPYRMAKTNNPPEYSVIFSGTWQSCRNVELTKSCPLGLTGIMAKTADSLVEIKVLFRDLNHPDFNSVRIFHNNAETHYALEVIGQSDRCSIHSKQLNDSFGYSLVQFDSFLNDSVIFRLIKKDTVNSCFHLYGLEFLNDDAGIVYNACGINGAEVTSFLRCDHFEEQLSLMKPALVIISLGTNDAYPVHFNAEEFYENFRKLIGIIRQNDPELPVLLTVPGDFYRKRKYVNKNIKPMRETILKLGETTNCAVWDFFSIMGGTRSIQKWYKAGLASRDKLHLTRKGYLLQGDLLYDALLKAFTDSIDRTNNK